MFAFLAQAGGLGFVGESFNQSRLGAAQVRRVLSCGSPKTMVPAGDFGQLSMDVDMTHEPPCGAIDSDYLQNPPSGAWYAREARGFSLGASTRSSIAFVLVPFVCLFSGGTLGWLYGTQIASGEFYFGPSLFGIPFVLLSIAFWTIALMAVVGKTVVTVNSNRGTVFVGIGPLGWTRSFDWSSTAVIQQEGSGVRYLGADNGGILLEGTTRLQFGTNLTETRRSFVLNALKYLKARSG
jgi:hypothetical protein